MNRHLWQIRKYFWFFPFLLSTSTLLYMYVKGGYRCNHDLKDDSFPISHKTNNYDNIEGDIINGKREQIPLLTLFTTWGANDQKHQVRRNILKNWRLLKPHVKPVFFYDNGTKLKPVKDHGWDVLPVSKSASGLPTLKNMYLDVMAKYKSTFYGYSNGDILFDHGLVESLLAVANASLIPSKPVLVIGRRTNVQVKDIPEDIGHDALPKLAKRKGRLFFIKAEDYFITDEFYPWQDIPELVVGRVAFDNWLVLDSCKKKFNVIEATPTLLAVHQTTEAGNFEGRHQKLPHYNKALLLKLHRKFNYSSGSTSCAPWITKAVNNSFTKQVKILRRKVPGYCYQY